MMGASAFFCSYGDFYRPDKITGATGFYKMAAVAGMGNANSNLCIKGIPVVSG